MEKLTLLYGTRFWNEDREKQALLGWFCEAIATEQTGCFHIAYFNYGDYVRGSELRVAVNKIPDYEVRLGIVHPYEVATREKPRRKDCPAILRCPYLGKEQYERLAHDLLHYGYRLISDTCLYGGPRWFRGLPTDEYMIPAHRGGESFGSSAFYSLQPTIYCVRDEDGMVPGARPEDSFVFGWVDARESKALVRRFEDMKAGATVGEVFFEKYVPVALCDGRPAAWRVFFFDGVPFHMGPIERAEAGCSCPPAPPDEVIDAFARAIPGTFASCDLVLEEGGGWKCSRIMDGQFTETPLGGDDREFAEGLAKAVRESPHLPEWSWCLTARVKDENEVGEDHKVVHGTRHFAPGAKVWLHPVNWDGRVGAIGVPRYSDRLTRVVMDVSKLEAFGIEKVTDEEIVAALIRPNRSWPFSRFKPLWVGGGPWGSSDEARERILHQIEWLSQK